MKRFSILLVVVLSILSSPLFGADEPSSSPKPIPAFRPAMKAALEALKQRQPRLPLPAPEQQSGVNNGRMRVTYLPESWGSGGSRD